MERKVCVTLIVQNSDELKIVISSLCGIFSYMHGIKVMKETFDFKNLYAEFQLETRFPDMTIRDLIKYDPPRKLQAVLLINNVIADL